MELKIGAGRKAVLVGYAGGCLANGGGIRGEICVHVFGGVALPQDERHERPADNEDLARDSLSVKMLTNLA